MMDPDRSRTRGAMMALGVMAAAGLAQAQGSSTTAAQQPVSFSYSYGAGSWGTLANIFFLLSALFVDILHVRVMLILAYLFLLLQVSLGFPSPQQWGRNPAVTTLQLGNIVWFAASLAFQLYGLAVLVLDEMPVQLSGDDEMLWRLFYRRCGITKREFSHVLKLGKWQHYKAGALIERRDRDVPRTAVIFKGAVRLDDRRHQLPSVHLATGQVLNLHLCNLFGVYIGFEQEPDHRSLAYAETDVTLFTWDVPAMMQMASGAASVAVPGYWRSFLLNVLALQYHRQQTDKVPYSSFGTPEPDPVAWSAGLVQTVDLTAPLRPEEQDKVTWRSVLRAMFGPLSLKVPPGVRHKANPKTGAMATARVLLAARMRQHHEPLPAALSFSLDIAMAEADPQVVGQLSPDVCKDLQEHCHHRHHKAHQQGQPAPSAENTIIHMDDVHDRGK